MSGKWPGGIISKTAPTVVGPTDLGGGEASGIWTLDQAADYEKQGLWPKPTIPQYLWTWGDNSYGQLGHGDTTSLSSPVQVGTDAWILTAANSYQQYGMAAIKPDNTLWMWGKNTTGQLGQGNTTDYSSPVQVGALTDWEKVSAAPDHTVAIKTDGTLWAWGSNSQGALGNGTTWNTSSPVQIGALTTWTEVAAGASQTTFAIRADGTLWNMGSTSQGKSGRGAGAASVSSPVQVGSSTDWATVYCGGKSNVGIQTDNTLWVWGQGADGVLGNGGTSNVSAPVQIGAAVWSKAEATQISMMIATRTDGTLWTWGRGNFGGLGLGNTTYYSSPKQVGALTDWDQPSCGRNYAGCLKTDGTIWCWGYNGGGALGQGDTTNRSSPVQVGSLTTWKSFSANSRFGRGLKIA